jgi:hypothetical protein
MHGEQFKINRPPPPPSARSTRVSTSNDSEQHVEAIGRVERLGVQSIVAWWLGSFLDNSFTTDVNRR